MDMYVLIITAVVSFVLVVYLTNRDNKIMKAASIKRAQEENE